MVSSIEIATDPIHANGAPISEAQEEALTLALTAPLVAGVLLIGSAAAQPDPLSAVGLGLALYTVVGLTLLIRHWRQQLALWWFPLGLMGVTLAGSLWTHTEAALSLLALPVGLATILLGVSRGMLIASACSVLLWITPEGFPALRLIASLNVWSIVALIWLAKRPLLTTLNWSWASFTQAQQALERARDYQLQLRQTLADLAKANLQLTRLNRLADALRYEAEAARRAKQEFVANVSHELRTPLNMILGFSEMITQAPQTYGKRLPKALIADLKVIVRNSQHLLGLIDDVLDLSQIDSGHMALIRERVSLRQIIEAATEAVMPLFTSKGLYLRLTVPDDLTIYCDSLRMREVVLNLLSNAGRFTEQGGVTIRAWQEAEEAVVTISDTGPGIAPESRDKLFQPFEQLDPSLRRRHGGTGLGLALSKMLVELHGGSMAIESEVGVGSTFILRLPTTLACAPSASSYSRWFNPYWSYEPHTRRPVAPHQPLLSRLVVLDKGSALARLVHRYLRDAEVVHTATVAAALAEIQRAPVRALLVNQSPGEEVWAAIQSARIPYGTPIIACFIPDEEAVARSLGATGYLIKPVSRETLLGAIDRLGPNIETVLVIDDEPDTLLLFWRMLSSSGRNYRVITADNGKEGLRMLRLEHPDVVLLDLTMPEMDGFRLLDALHADHQLTSTPVILVTARDPVGQLIVSDQLVATRAGGLSIAHVLACMQALSELLAPSNRPIHPTASENQPERQVS